MTFVIAGRAIYIREYIWISMVLIVFINEVDNDPASKALEIVQTYLRKNSNYGFSLQMEKLEIGKTSAQEDIEKSAYCK